ncbi:PsiF family protein, partial [Serratia ureilytica]
MTDCNQQASTKSLKGADRSTFASTCLEIRSARRDGQTLTPQQQKMNCNADAKT